ncbi:Eco57I restriction-modification methylase domain-containing protein [Nonomuraea sp. NPDC059007]|uniref:Eco57I restriction-modification methylase domain-containing protein n=1 Tax=Nonomuraea sp. NPDC059007 TaxID=3346692 RepID=UPI0036C6CA12
MRLDSLVNRGDYFSAHYLAEVLPKDLKKKDGLLDRWKEQEKDGRVTPRKGLRALGKPYFAERPFFADMDVRLREGDLDDLPEWKKELGELHIDVLKGFAYQAEPREITIERAGGDYPVQVAYADDHLIAVECGWAAEVDAGLEARLLYPVQLDSRERIEEGTKLASWLFAAENPRRYVLLLAGGVVVLTDRATWGEGRYLAVSLDVALGRNDPAELDVIAALFGADSLLPRAEGGSEPLADLLANSRNHAVGVSKELREGLKDSVELIANEVLRRIHEQGARPQDIMEPRALAKELGREALRYLYRILFLLYAEARPELGILPTDDEDYVRGYSLARLGDLVVRDLVGEEARNGFHLYESLDLLFRMVNTGHRPRTGEEGSEASDGEGLRFEPLRSELFHPEAIGLIRRDLPVDDDPLDEEEFRTIDTRLRNGTLYKVLRKLMLTRGRRKERGGFISYAQLGINQLGAVYEGLMSYTGFIATEELYEVAKGGDPSDGSWMIPASKVDEYPAEVFVHRIDEETGARLDEYVRYPAGWFVYRLAGRDRQTSASYYTPESLTKVTVQLALQHRVTEETTAQEILSWKICEPALGSGAFLNEAINQVADLYLKRRQAELGVQIDPEAYEEELQKAKAYIALHNSYGVDLNETAIELAEVSLWLNVMHPGLQAPWFGLHLRRGNSLIGASRRVYGAHQLTKGEWLKTAPDELPFSTGSLPAGKVHHFLLPAEGWGAIADAKEAKALAPEQAKQLKVWQKKLRAKVSDKKAVGRRLSQLKRLQELSARAEYLWNLVVERLTISEREISRKIEVWGADWIDQPTIAVSKDKVYKDLISPGTPYWRLKKLMDAWCALWFWPLDQAGLLDGTAPAYGGDDSELEPVRLAPGIGELEVTADSAEATSVAAAEPTGFGQVYVTESLFGVVDKQLDLVDYATEAKVVAGSGPKKAPKLRPQIDPVRKVIPLANLDDWLDFADAVLGRADIPEDSLVAHFESLADLETYEDQLPSWMGMDSEFKLSERFPWLDFAEDIAEEQGFFHWKLQFAQIFTKGGFDLQVGNPPWVRPDWQEDAVLAEFEPWFKLAEKPSVVEWNDRKSALLEDGYALRDFTGELAANVGITEFLGGGISYPLMAGTKPDLYRAFMCRAWANLGLAGTAGLIHPDTHFGGVKEGNLRAAAYRHLRFHAHYSNRYELFEIEGTRQFGVHIYGAPGGIGFTNMSWLFDPATLLGSLDHDGSGELPGIKHNGKWELRPHRARLVHVDDALLQQWQALTGSGSLPVDHTPLLYPVTIAEAGAIGAFVAYPTRISSRSPRISIGYDEGQAKKNGLIRWRTGQPNSLDDVILQGPHLAQASLFNKQPNVPCKTNRDWSLWNLRSLPEDAVPVTNYERATNEDDYFAAQDLWGTTDGGALRYTRFYRLTWRDMIPFDTERSLFAALIPPGPAHVNAVRSMALADNTSTVLAAGFWAALPLDYLLRITGRAHLSVAEANWMPTADPAHPLASALVLRTLRLSCQTNAYADLWAELYDPAWVQETWAVERPGLQPLAEGVTPEWHYGTPLRTERERRAALVELDAMVALWLGMTADQLVAIYRSRYPVLSDYEAQIWFDVNGRKIAGNHNTYGYGQTKADFEALMDHLDPDINGPVPDGYTAPFYKADREAEYIQAHAHFAERLAASGWIGPADGRAE